MPPSQYSRLSTPSTAPPSYYSVSPHHNRHALSQADRSQLLAGSLATHQSDHGLVQQSFAPLEADHYSQLPTGRPNSNLSSSGLESYGTVTIPTSGRARQSRTDRVIVLILACVVIILVGCTIFRCPSFETGLQLERQAWQREREEHAAEVQYWRQERAEHERERQVFEKERAEWDHARQARKPFWGEPTLDSSACLAYNTMRYKAHLWNIQLLSEGLNACWSTSIMIHNRTLPRPDQCSVSVDGIVGFWKVDFDEPGCRPRWGDTTWDKGCVRPGVHAYEAPLWGQKYGDDVRAMCMTTPGNLSGHGYMGPPTYCEQRGDKDIGMVGRWEIPDNRCR